VQVPGPEGAGVGADGVGSDGVGGGGGTGVGDGGVGRSGTGVGVTAPPHWPFAGSAGWQVVSMQLQPWQHLADVHPVSHARVQLRLAFDGMIADVMSCGMLADRARATRSALIGYKF
jgi:hypothetical protein